MTPRSVEPEKTYLITRRCSQGQFLLRPSDDLNRLVVYLLGVACALFGVRVHAACFMSNHYHLVVTDDAAQLPEFMHFFNALLARCVNRMLGRREAVFVAGSYHRVELLDEGAVMGEMVYVLANPVKAGLVRRGQTWPGVRLGPWHLNKGLRVTRPGKFFARGGAMPESAELRVSAPGELGHGDRFVARLSKAVDEREAEWIEEHRRSGTPFLGRTGVLMSSPMGHPVDGPEPRKARVVAASDPEAEKAAIEAIGQWLDAYEAARCRFRSGDRKARFPAGTYWLRVHVGVRCEPG